MIFSSMTFLWVFLPMVLVLYQLPLGVKYKNGLLLIVSLLFYSWGEPKYILLMLASIVLNYLLGIACGRLRKASKWIVALAVAVNIGLLFYFKYFDFFADTVNKLSGGTLIALRDIALPVGISFYTFQALSYVIDVYREKTPPQKNLFRLALYISLFPQLIAGPIVRYCDVERQLTARTVTMSKAAYGIRRFIVGLSKKVLIANVVAVAADDIFALPKGQLSPVIAWTGAILYGIQIYYDFSGYSDMAIGLGRIFGFDFTENFNLPYTSASVQEFWRRWHISLSTWFREYLYFPLGGSRRGIVRTCVNTMIVFLATGLWHGAASNFVIWGVYFGILLIAERLFLGKLLKRMPAFAGRIYCLFVVFMGWVIFRSHGIKNALDYIAAMFLPAKRGTWNLYEFVSVKTAAALVLGILFCGLVQRLVYPRLRPLLSQKKTLRSILPYVKTAVLFAAFALCIIFIAAETYNPFIYFRF